MPCLCIRSDWVFSESSLSCLSETRRIWDRYSFALAWLLFEPTESASDASLQPLEFFDGMSSPGLRLSTENFLYSNGTSGMHPLRLAQLGGLSKFEFAVGNWCWELLWSFLLVRSWLLLSLTLSTWIASGAMLSVPGKNWLIWMELLGRIEELLFPWNTSSAITFDPELDLAKLTWLLLGKN